MVQTSILRVGVDSRDAERGARRAEQAINRTGRSALRTEGHFAVLQNRLGGLRAAFLALGSVLVVREFSRLLDTTITINNRLRLVTNTVDQLNVVYSELVQVSRDTRTSLEANANVFNRVALSTRQLNLTYGELIDFVRAYNQAVQISGATTQEALNATIQFTQGLASNRLAGDELRSVLEQLPRVADVIAQRLGTTRGGLRDLARQSKITSSVIIAAFQDAADDLAEEFTRVTPTISQAFTVLSNRILDFVNTLEMSSQGPGRTLAELILLLSDNFNILLGVASGVAIIIGTVLVRAFAALTIAIASNPIGLLIVGFTAAVTALIAFSDVVVEVGDRSVTVWEAMRASLATVGDVFFDYRKTQQRQASERCSILLLQPFSQVKH